MNVQGAINAITRWISDHKRRMSEPELDAILEKYTRNDTELAEMKDLLGSPYAEQSLLANLAEQAEKQRFVVFTTGPQIGSTVDEESWEREEAGYLKRGETPPGVVYIAPQHYDIDLANRFQAELMKELREPFGGLLKPGRFPKRDAALRNMGRITVTRVHENGDLDFNAQGKHWHVTAQGRLTDPPGDVSSSLNRSIDVMTRFGQSASRELPGPIGGVVGKTAGRYGEILKESVKEKKHLPWQVEVFGPLGAWMVPKKRDDGPDDEEIHLSEG